LRRSGGLLQHITSVLRSPRHKWRRRCDIQ
jgi:hypothetical protein